MIGDQMVLGSVVILREKNFGSSPLKRRSILKENK